MDVSAHQSMMNTAISNILMPNSQNTLVACQLEHSAPNTNEYFRERNSNYLYYDVPFATFKPDDGKIYAYSIPSSIPFRI